MKLFLFTVLLITASFLLTSCAPPPAGNNANVNKPANSTSNANSTASGEADVKKMIADFSAALNKGDAAALDKMYADDYTLIDQFGAVHTKAQRVEDIKSGKLKFEGIAFDEVKVKVSPSGDAAVVTARASGKSTMDGKTNDINSRVTWALGKMKDGWRFVTAQITDIRDAAKSDDKADDKADDKKSGDKKGDSAANSNSGEKKNP